MTVDRDPRAEYDRRLKERRAAAARFDRQDQRISVMRLITTIVFVILAVLSLWQRTAPVWWLVAPIVGFAILVIFHERVARARRRASKAADFYDDGLARLEDRWSGADSF